MENTVSFDDRQIGGEAPCFVIAEIGINHNGSIEIAKKLIDVAIEAGCEAVKFQKRSVDVVYSREKLQSYRESPFGKTEADLKYGLEFDRDAYEEIDSYCRAKDILWCASCWDEASVDFIDQFSPPCFKIASASLTDQGLLKHHRSKGRPLILSTGMSSIEQIDEAVETLGTQDLVLLHCVSTYPARPDELNLRSIQSLRARYGVPVGYSGHEVGVATTIAAVALGAAVVERHITLDRSMWGSDQAASVEPQGLQRIVRDLRSVESALGDGVKRLLESEIPVMDKLRRINR